MSSRDVLCHLQQRLCEWVHHQELRAVSGIDDVPRLIRSLRQRGYQLESRGDGYCRLTAHDPTAPRGVRGAISNRERFLAFHKSGHRCCSCGRAAIDGAKLVVDHIVPVDWGGTSDQDNLQALCEDCNHGKQAWVSGTPSHAMRRVFEAQTVEQRIEALFEELPDQDVPSLLVQLVSRNALDWQRALRKIRERTGKRIVPVNNCRAYRYLSTTDDGVVGPEPELELFDWPLSPSQAS